MHPPSRISVKPSVSSTTDAALRRTRDGEVDAVGEQAVVHRVGRLHEVVDRAAGTFDVARDHVARDVAGHVDRVVAEAADDAREHVRLRRQHVDRVVTFEGVNLEDLDVGVGHRETGAVDRLVR
jgi:hypothetical protein